MSKRRMALAGIMGITILIVIAFAYLSNEAPETSDVIIATSAAVEAECLLDDAGNCQYFPIISGENLLGEVMTFPDDFTGEYNLAIVPFDRDQQQLADTWLPFAQELAAAYPDFQYYNIPIFPDLAPAIRMIARTGLDLMIDDERIKQVFVMVFLVDRQVFLDALAIPDVEQIQTFLVTPDGQVIWRSTGVFSEETGAELSAIIDGFND